MKTRIISGAVLFVLLVAIILLGEEVFCASIFILTGIGIYEFYHSVETGGYRPVRIIGYIASLYILYLGISRYGGKDSIFSPAAIAAAVFILGLILLCYLVFKSRLYNIADISLTVFGIVYVVGFFSFLVMVRNLENGVYLIGLVFIGAFITDTCAYFTGKAIGKRKLIPAVSPNKTVEGSLGGIAGCMILMTAFGAYINTCIPAIPLYHYLILGVLCGIISQLGDLTASAIKRYVGIKDYGNIMPGHGGVLDRFDSILFVAPTVYFYLMLVVR